MSGAGKIPPPRQRPARASRIRVAKGLTFISVQATREAAGSRLLWPQLEAAVLDGCSASRAAAVLAKPTYRTTLPSRNFQ